MYQRINNHHFNANNKKSAKKQKGMTFIEVLVSLFIMVTGILGAVAMQANAKKGSFDAMQRSLASSLTQDIIERMRSNDFNAIGAYAGVNYGAALNAVPTKRCSTRAGLCTPAEMAINDQYEWELALMGADVTNGSDSAGGLVDARACVSVNNNAVTVVITWEGRTELINGSTEGCGTTGSQRRQVSVEAFVF